ncbi:aminopeptidase P family protein [Breoghania sp.]|uniref:aminopeptidase P family protein n=1 Tax=Breoghania sp. TaxID=2065378 RepID=UPI0026188542|nr:aminopeptidase P family protein [Breoghania sp.]MDJ0931167.1 aminopeptidase P family protein [Breoghania sp.]
MFQSYDPPSESYVHGDRLVALGAELNRRGLDGFIALHTDTHQNEYVAPSEERLAWLTGFTGSAGAAVVLPDQAAIFVDGRYTIQVRDQVDAKLFEPLHLIETPPYTWIQLKAKKGMRIGYDAMLHTVNGVKKLKSACEKVGAELVPVDGNPIDTVWTDRPEPPLEPVVLHPMSSAGQGAKDKIERLKAELREGGCDAAVILQPDSIAWLFNIRGHDLPHLPVALAFAIVRADAKPLLFIDHRKMSNTVADALGQLAEVGEPDGFLSALDGFSGKTVLVDPDMSGDATVQRLEANGAKVRLGDNPVMLPKAVKNAVEIEGSRAAHRRDAVAFARFLLWFEKTAPSGGLNEISVSEALEGFRAETGKLKDISFDTISGTGPNAAICHYRVTTASSLPLEMNNLYLVDSGAQYEDGTTDITRTMAVGEPSEEMRQQFTLVLKGHIGISTARFPAGTSGAQLDALARIPLWKAGLDFDHGTGHGVGAYLSVHEGPQRIAKTGKTPLEPGMIISNEPGYYKDGAWGIRIENLELVTEATPIEGGERPMLGFETLTLVPIDRRLIVTSILNADERDWVDAYHARVRKEIGSLLDAETRAWLEAATEPLQD